MTPQEAIIKNGHANLESLELEWAQKHYVLTYQSRFDTDAAKLQVEACKKQMLEIQEKIDFTKEYLKDNK